MPDSPEYPRLNPNANPAERAAWLREVSARLLDGIVLPENVSFKETVASDEANNFTSTDSSGKTPETPRESADDGGSDVSPNEAGETVKPRPILSFDFEKETFVLDDTELDVDEPTDKILRLLYAMDPAATATTRQLLALLSGVSEINDSSQLFEKIEAINSSFYKEREFNLINLEVRKAGEESNPRVRLNPDIKCQKLTTAKAKKLGPEIFELPN